MASLSDNIIVRSIRPGAVFEDIQNMVNSSISINQGDLCFLDTATHLVKPTTGGATEGAKILGISPVKIVSGLIPSPYQGTAVDASQKATSIPGPVYGVVGKLTLKTGDAFNPGDQVYVTATDAQTVSVTANGSSIGVFVGVAVASATAGQKGEVHVGSRYPSDVLSF